MAKTVRFLAWLALLCSLQFGAVMAQTFGSNGPNPPANSPSDPAPVAGCEVRTDTPVNANGDHVALQCDSTGALKIGSTTPAAGSSSTTPNFVVPATSTVTDRSGAITTGGTAQQLTGPSTTRKRIIVQNPCTAATQNIATAENLYVRTTGTASAAGGSWELQPCYTFDTGPGPAPPAAITVFAATTGHRYTATEQ